VLLTPEGIIFIVLSLGIVGMSIFCMTRRNPVTAVMSLVASFFGLAAMYATLSAHFLAVLQVLVYAGAIMVLFVFVIMILNKEEEEPWALRGWFGKTLAAAALTWFLARIVQVLWSINQTPAVAEKVWKAGEFIQYGSTKAVGKQLFTSYLFPFEAISIALLIAIVGAVVLAHPEHATEGGGHARGPAGHGPGEAESMQNVANAFWHLSVGHFLALAAVLFVIGAVGALLRRNALIVLMSVELMMNAANLALVAFGRSHHDSHAHAFAFIVMAVAAAEAAVGLAIVVGIFRNRRSVNIDELTLMKH